MNREDIIRMARAAASADGTNPLDRNVVLYAAKSAVFLERFAALVAAAEREACAMACEGLTPEWPDQPGIAQAEWMTMLDCAATIRARGQP
jgi:hypothetical protein